MNFWNKINRIIIMTKVMIKWMNGIFGISSYSKLDSKVGKLELLHDRILK